MFKNNRRVYNSLSNTFNTMNTFTKLQSHTLYRKTIRKFATTVETNFAEKGSKDIIRVAAIYGMCGTIASYFDMMYNGKVFILKWTIPQPERFLLCAFGWGIAGCVSWLFFWSRSDIIIRAAASRVRYGIVDGSRTSLLALGATSGAIALFSIYFDYIAYRTQRTQYHATMSPSMMTDYGNNNSGIGSPNGVVPPNEHVFDEDDDDDDEEEEEESENENGKDGKKDTISDSMILAEQANNILISSKFPKRSKKNKNKNKNKNVINSRKDNTMEKPEWNWDNVLTNVYQPCKLFWQCNAPIWLLFGTVTGVFTARIMTYNALTHGIGAAIGASMLYQNDNENNDNNNNNSFDMLTDKIKDENEKDTTKQIELFRFSFDKNH